mmetsp:Transcript_42747/g.54930  ORF Transcript_42747/g.54930 Transcript_42747/m.54930 type:complete len:259 (+) Transcript_42747:327-1103(+)
MKTKGRRTTMDTNVFWGVLAAILPESIVHDRKQREAARMLGVDASVIRKGVDYRAALETGWKPIITSTHYDNVDWHPMVEWIHSEGSTVDNDHKDMVEVSITNNETGEVTIENHPRRYPDDKRRALLVKFKASQTFETMQRSLQEKEKDKRLKRATRTVEHNNHNTHSMGEDEFDELVDKEMKVLQVKWRQEEATRRATKKVMDLNEERRDPTPAEIEEELERVPNYPELTVSYSKFSSSFCKCITANRRCILVNKVG